MAVSSVLSVPKQGRVNSVPRPAVWFPALRTGTGADVFTTNLANGLRKRGIRAEITWLPRRAEYLPWAVPAPKPPEWASIVHVNTWMHPRFIPKNLPVVATLHHSVHDPALRRYKGVPQALYHRFWVRSIERRVLRRAKIAVSVSRFAADVARKRICEVPMRIIHNGVDRDIFRPQSRLSWDPQSFNLLYVGSWVGRKGVDLLVPIMRELGDGFMLYYTGGLAALRDRATMPPNMRDLGRLSVDEVAVAMQRSDAFVFPSRNEGFGLVVAESMACGLPVIAARATSVPEIVDDGVTGMLCASGDVEAFVKAARRLAADSDYRRRLAEAASVVAGQRFGVDRMCEEYVRVYECIESRAALVGQVLAR